MKTFKSVMVNILSGLLILISTAVVCHDATIQKGLLGEQDIHRWDGTSSKTFSRATSVGGTLTLNDFGYEVDALMSYGGGVSYTKATIDTAVAAIGTTNKATLVLRPGTWVISATADYSAYTNILFKIPPGALIQYSANVTLPAMDETGMHQRFIKISGTLSFGRNAVSRVIPQWWGASVIATAASNSVAFQAWLDSVGTYPSIPLHVPGVTLSSSSAYQINTALTKTSADWIRISGDGSGSWLEWTGANYATLLSLTGAGSGNAAVDSIRFDCNDKCTTGLEMKGFGHGISVTKSEFNDGLANVADDQGMLNIPKSNETHNGLIQRNYFGGGTAIGIGLGMTGASAASSGFDISVNEFQQINNWSIKANGLKESEVHTNIIDGNASHANAAGFYFDNASGIVISSNHMETLDNAFISLNPTGSYAFRPSTGKISNNFMVAGGVTYITLGSTDDVVLEGNTSLNTGGVMWLSASTNAIGTIVGKNTYSSALTGSMSWAEQYITGAGKWTNRFSTNTVFSTTALLTLTAQSASTNWVTLSPISTLNEPDIPSTARGWVVQASIKSATVGARLYLFSAGADQVLWINRATSIKVQYIEAQTAGRYNTATIIIPAVNQSYEDLFSYGISDGGANDTDVELRLVGYLMPT